MQKFKYFTRLLLLITVFTFTNCQKEDDEIIPYKTELIKTTMSLEHFWFKEQVVSEINNIKKAQSSFTELEGQKRIIYDSINEFYVDVDNIIVIEAGEYHWLTLNVYSSINSNILENLVLKYNVSNGTYSSFITEVEMSNDEISSLINGEQIPDLETRIDIRPALVSTNNINGRSGGYSGKSWKRKDGTCFRLDDVVAYQDGSFDYTIVDTPCTASSIPLNNEIDAGPSSGGGGSNTNSGPNYVNYNGTHSNSDGSNNSNQNGGSTSGGSVNYNNHIFTSPNVNIVSQLKNMIGLSNLGINNDNDLIQWLDTPSLNTFHTIMSIYFDLKVKEDNNVNISQQDKEIAKLKLTIEYINDSTDPKWDQGQIGTFNNTSSLEYIATYDLPNNGGTMYLLDNGGNPDPNSYQALFISNQPHNINGQYANTIGPTDFPLDNVYAYIYDYNSKQFYEFGLPLSDTDCLGCDLNDFFEYVLVNGLTIVGRYFIPLEDMIILIEGKDFDGVESSRAVAGGFLLLEVIPGSDILKLVKFIKYGDEAIQVANAIRKIADDIYLAQRKVIDEYANNLLIATNKLKGNFGEIATDVDLYEKGYKRLQTRPLTSLDDAGHTGIDHVFKNEETGEYLIIESKWGNNGLNQANPNTGLSRQMSDEWITDESVGDTDRLFQALGENVATYQDILSSGYKRLKANVAPDGSVVYRLVSSDGYQINGTIGIFTP